jgi:hypothetical protein
MGPKHCCSTHRLLLAALGVLILFAPLLPVSTLAQTPSAADPLPSWNDGGAKKAIIDFVKATTDQSSPNFVAAEARIAAFDQDGTLWVEHPMYTQVEKRCSPAIARQWQS